MVSTISPKRWGWITTERQPMPEPCSAIVIGGGHNGLVAANYLSRAGLKILVLERRALVGGACVTEELFPGFHLSACSYVCHLLQDKVVEDLALQQHGFEVFPLDPFRFHPHPGGQYIFSWHDDEQTAREIQRIAPADARRFREWAEFWRCAAGILHRYFLEDPPTLTQIAADLKGAEAAVFERMLTGSMEDLVREYFDSEVVQGAFIDAQDAGDVSAPGSIMAVAYIRCNQFTNHHNLGIPRGGMGNITQSLARAARAEGVEIRTHAEVERITVHDNRATGVILSSGEEIRADILLSNADPKRTFLKLLDQDALAPESTASVQRLKTAASYLKFHCALRELPDFSSYLGADFDPGLLAQIRLCPSIEYFEQSWDDARNGRPSSCPVMTIQIPTVHDSGLAPPGRHILSVWSLYAPVRLQQGTWDQKRREVGEHLIDTLTHYAPNFRDALIHWNLFTPADLEQRIYLTDGNIRHLDIVPAQMLAQRPGYRTSIAGLYLCGAGTHPGGEVTGAPGHNAARTVLQDLEN